MKRIFKYLFCLLLSLVVITRVDALSVDKKSIDIDVGGNDKINIYANVENANSVEFDLIYSNNDIKIEFVKNDAFSETTPSNNRHIIKFNEIKNGKILLGTVNINALDNPKNYTSNINIKNGIYNDKDGNELNLKEQSITVKINEIGNNLLDRIESDIVSIKLKKNVFKYSVTIDKDIEELDLEPIAKKSNTEITIDTQKIAELKDNKLVIKTKNNNIEQDYIIDIKRNTLLIDDSNFNPDDSYKSKWKLLLIGSSIIVAISIPICIRMNYKRKKFYKKIKRKK